MPKRREFPAKVKVAAFERAGGRCEACGCKLTIGKIRYDHRVPDGMGGEPTADNCQVLCSGCHDTKTTEQDVPNIAKAKRREARHKGAHRSRNPLPGGRDSPWKIKLDGSVVPRA